VFTGFLLVLICFGILPFFELDVNKYGASKAIHAEFLQGHERSLVAQATGLFCSHHFFIEFPGQVLDAQLPQVA
jgi:hypothetical protein